jgi:hypothetical protein
MMAKALLSVPGAESMANYAMTRSIKRSTHRHVLRMENV